MKTRIHAFDPATRSVPVTFRSGTIVHKRSVNACLDDAGAYDPKATRIRVAEVAAGVVRKIEIGVIS